MPRPKGTLLADQRGTVAFEMLIVYLAVLMTLLLPLADLALFGFQYLSAWEALRAFGHYIQYNPPPDATNTTSWTTGLQKTISGYTISNIQVLCSDTGSGVPCTSSNISTLPVKYYFFSTTVTVSPFVLRSVLCTSGNANPCSVTLNHSERFL